MGSWNLGSVADFTWRVLQDIPTALSGTTLLEIADQQRQFVADRINTEIGSNGIILQYQGPIANLTISQVAGLMIAVGIDANSVSLGDFKIDKGEKSNLSEIQITFKEMAMMQLENIGVGTMRFYKALG